VLVEVCIHFNRSAANWNLQFKTTSQLPISGDDWPPSASKRKDCLRKGFTDALLLAHYGQEAAKEVDHGIFTSSFLNYFQGPHATAVVNVFANVPGSELETGNDKYINRIFFKYGDTTGTCKKHPDWTAYNQPTSHERAAESDIMICEHGWTAVEELRLPPGQV
jgi:hypothetical protein